jgi:predicted RND superfamily exporter protein
MKYLSGKWLAQAVADRIVAAPYRAFGLGLAVCMTMAFFAAKLEFDTGFMALLPENAHEVKEVNALRERAGGTVELVVAVGGREDARLPFARELVRALRNKPWIQRADVEFPIEFFKERKLYLLPIAQLRKLQQAIDEEIGRAKARANPLYVDREEDAPTPWAEVDTRETLEQKRGLLKSTFSSSDGKYLFVRVKPKGTSFDMSAGAVLLANIKGQVEEISPKRHGVVVRYAGGLPINQEQHQQMNEDLRFASVLALVLVLVLLAGYIRRPETLLIVAIPLVGGLCITMGITALTIGRLNLVSGFLVTALIGLGIDFEIHLYLRYLEELGESGDRVESMRKAIAGTLPGGITGALTTAAAFFSMAISDSRGFREYGQIAGLGVLVTLVAAYVMLPALALTVTRSVKRRKARGPAKRVFGRGLATMIVAASAAILIFSLYVSPRIRFRSNFKQLQSTSEAAKFSAYVDQTFGSLSPAGILVRDVEQARRVEEWLVARSKQPNAVIDRVLSLAAMTPTQVEQRVAILAEMRKSLQDVLKEKLSKADRMRVLDALKLVEARPWSPRDIPAVYRKQFMTLEEDGTFVFVWPSLEMGEDVEVIAWADELNQIQRELAAIGIPVKILDENRVAGRVLKEMRIDGPYVLAYAGIAILILLVLDFRDLRKVALVYGSLGVGLVWMLGVMYAYDIEINVFNLAIIPTVLGLGIDNAIHLQHRYSQEGPGSVGYVLSTTGSASFLASATTVIGFGAAITAHHLGVQSMGTLAVVGFSCAFFSTTVFFPALLQLLEGRQPRRGGG